jgi:hypothetical protein
MPEGGRKRWRYDEYGHLQPWHAIWEEKMNRTTEFVPDI